LSHGGIAVRDEGDIQIKKKEKKEKISN